MANAPYEMFYVHGNEPWKSVEGKTFATPSGSAGGVVPAAQASYGGGSKVTGDNLVVSWWSITDTTTGGTPTAGARLVPVPSQPPFFNEPGELSTVILEQYASSRLSSRIVLAVDSGDAPSGIAAVMAFLNPPPGYKNYVRNALSGFDTASKVSEGVIHKGLLGGWMFKLGMSLMVGQAVGETDIPGALADVAGFTGSTGGDIPPFAKTSGADGELPTFYPSAGDDGPDSELLYMRGLQQAFESGIFFIPVLFTWDDISQDAMFLDIEWPASATL